jgi:hypothetical protein
MRKFVWRGVGTKNLIPNAATLCRVRATPSSGGAAAKWVGRENDTGHDQHQTDGMIGVK